MYDEQQSSPSHNLEVPTEQNSFYRTNRENARTDKLLAKEDIGKIEMLIRKDRLELSDLRNLVYLLAGAEDRILIGKFLTWIRDLIAIYEVRIKNNVILRAKEGTTRETLLAIKTISQMYDEYIKYLAALFLYGTRSSLSLGATAFSSLNTEKYEYEYNTKATNVNQEIANKKKIMGVI